MSSCDPTPRRWRFSIPDGRSDSDRRYLYGVYCPQSDLTVQETGRPYTGAPKGVEWIDPINDLPWVRTKSTFGSLSPGDCFVGNPHGGFIFLRTDRPGLAVRLTDGRVIEWDDAAQVREVPAMMAAMGSMLASIG